MKKTDITKFSKRILAFILAMTMMILLFPAASIASAAVTPGDVIFNYPYSPTAGVPYDFEPKNDIYVDHNDGITFPMYQGNEQAYTVAMSEAYNGAATPDHMVASGNQLTFYGYGIKPYMDYAFTNKYVSLGAAFILNPLVMNFHTFSESGYLFNGVMANGCYTGYALILACGNSAGMQENDITAPNTAAMRLYYINNELWSTNFFYPGSSAAGGTRTLIATIKTNISNFSTTAFRISTEIAPDRSFKLYVDGDMCASVDAPLGSSTDTGFGFYTGYYAHDCTRLTIIRYEGITIDMPPTAPYTPSDATVKFVDYDNPTRELCAADTEDGYFGQKYYVVQPQSIMVDEGGTEVEYLLMKNSRNTSIQSDIQLKYMASSTQNETTLYYARFDSPSLIGIDPRKSAKVNDGAWNNGTVTAPVPVQAGDEIDYNLTVFPSPPIPPAMLAPSNGGGAATNPIGYAQPAAAPSIQQQQVVSVTFVDLDTSYASVADFTAGTGNMWNGTEISKVWDATATATQNNTAAAFASRKVYAWATPNGANYDVFFGAYGGVTLNVNCKYLFYNFTKVTSIDFAGARSDLTTDMSYMFTNCNALTSLDLSSFNTTNVTTMANMFVSCKALTSLNLSSFNTANVTNMNALFYGCSVLTPLNVSTFDTSKVTVMSSMFSGCTALTSLNLNTFNTANVTTMASMFSGCAAFTSLNLNTFNTTNVTDMSLMFQNCSKLTSLNLNMFNTVNVTTMASMFAGCTVLTSLNLSTFNTTNVTTMASMFSGCAAFTSLNLNTFNTTNVTIMQNMFNGCAGLTSLSLSTFNTTNVTDMSGMFNGCTKLTSLNLNTFDTTNVTTMASMFYNCSGLTSLNLNTFNTANVTMMSSMFYGCSGLTSLNLRSFNTAKLTNTLSMFQACTKLTSLNLNTFDTTNVTTMQNMFNACSALTSLNLSSFNTTKVTNMINMFYACGALTSLDLSTFNTANVTSMANMFYTCSALTSLDLSMFDTTKVTNMSTMFQGCGGFSSLGFSLDLSGFNLTTAPTRTNMFNAINSNVNVLVNDVTAGTTWVKVSGSAFPATGTVSLGTPKSPATPATPATPVIAPLTTPVPTTPATPTLTTPTTPVDWILAFDPLPDLINPAYDVVDIIPAGLTVGAASGSQYDGTAITAIDTVGQTVTWHIPEGVTSYPLTLDVIVTADPGVDGTKFNNTATVMLATGNKISNTTYNELLVGYLVTEQYYLYDGGTTTNKLDMDVTTPVDLGNTYSAIGGTSLSGFTYCGYAIDGGAFIEGTTPPTGLSVSDNMTLKLYYKQLYPTVTVYFLDQDGNTLQAPIIIPVTSGTDWYIRQSYYDSIGAYNYYGYEMGSPDGTSPAPGSTPNYLDGANPIFAGITSNQAVTLYFTDELKKVTVNFVELGNPENVMQSPVTYLITSSVTPDVPPSIVSSDGKTYNYTAQYDIDGGAITSGVPGSINSACEVTLYYSTDYTITERYLTKKADWVYNIDTAQWEEEFKYVELQSSNITVIPGGDPFNGTIPPAFDDKAGDGRYVYTGYAFDNPDNPLTADASLLIDPVFGDYNVEYVYLAPFYNIYYDGNGNTGGTNPEDTADYPYDDPVTVMDNGTLVKRGYVFTGWNTKPDGTGMPVSPDDIINIHDDIYLYAQWAKDTAYTVVYAPGTQGTWSTTDAGYTTTDLYSGDATPAAPATPGQPGWRFTGWDVTPSATVTGDATYTAQWEQIDYTVIYDPGTQGTWNASDETTTGLHYGDTTPAEPATPGNSGWRFTGWDVTPSATVNGNATYTAQWEQIDYTVIYDPGTQGTWNASDETTTGLHYGDTTPTAPATTGEPGWRFTGWSPAVTNTVTGDATYTAQWKLIDYTITYAPGDHGNWTDEDHTANYGDTTPSFAGDTANCDTGWRFTGWSPAVANTVTGDVTYVAQWEQIYTVTYAPGTQGAWNATDAGYTTSGLIYGDATPAEPATPSNSGYRFTGWDVTPSATVTGNATYTAQWEATGGYTVTYAPGTQGTWNAADAGYTTAGLIYGDATPAEPANKPSNPGYEFTGWDTTPAATVTGSVTYTAQWKLIDYTITYAPGTQGNWTDENHIANYGDTTPSFAGDTANCTPGWRFTGWSPVISNTVTGDVTYVAQWEQIDYTVIYDPGTQGAWNASDAGYTTTGLHYGNNTPAVPPTPGKTGYDFDGWDITPSATVTGDMTYTAQWKPQKYNVTYILTDENGNTSVYATETDLPYGSTNNVQADPSKPGCTFGGWSSDVTISGGTYTMPDHDLVFYGELLAEPYNYTVEHYYLYESGSTIDRLALTENDLLGNYGKTVYATPKTDFTGYAYDSTFSGNVTSGIVDGTLVLKLYYRPNVHNIAYNYTGEIPTDAPALPADKTAAYGTAQTVADRPDVPEIPGYTFDGWYLNGAKVTDFTMPDNDVVLTGKWTAIDYTVTYAPGAHGAWSVDGAGYTTEFMHYGDPTPAEPPTPGNPGWRFIGWDVTPSATVTGNATYTAVWEQIEYTVVYAPGTQGTWSESDATTAGLHYGDPTPAQPATPGNSGWKFIGWDVTPSATVSGNVIYTALWEKATTTFIPPTPTPAPSETTTTEPATTSTPTSPAVIYGEPEDEPTTEPTITATEEAPTTEMMTETETTIASEEISNEQVKEEITENNEFTDEAEITIVKPAEPAINAPVNPAEPTTVTESEILPGSIVLSPNTTKSAVRLDNGWTAEPIDDNYWEIFDENGVSMGVVFLPAGEDIETYDVISNLIPLDKVTMSDEPTNANTDVTENVVSVSKNNPKTSDSADFMFILFGLMAICGIVTVLVIKRKANGK